MAEPGSPYLLVPVALEALVTNQSDLARTTWSNPVRAYTGLGRKDDLAPPPFFRGNDRPRLGVTLHWALPDALTRGRLDDAGARVFPLIPNRWLVLRTARGPDRKPAKAWVVDSDYVESGDGAKDEGTLFPSGRDRWTRIGRKRPLAEWSESGTNEPFLTAMGPGDDPSFAAFAVNVDNVLSFHDPLDDTEELGIFNPDGRAADAATLSYLVVGWYASAESDPLYVQDRLGSALPKAWHARRSERPMEGEDVGDPSWHTGAEWRDVMRTLGWSLGDDMDLSVALDTRTGSSESDAPREVYPSRTLYHGFVHSVRWTGRFQGAAQPFLRGSDSAFSATAVASRSLRRSAGSYKGWRDDEFTDRQAPSLSDFPHIAVGCSTIDALAALAEHLLEGDSEADISTLFQALEYDLMDRYDEPAGQVELRQRIHQRWFVESRGGTAWDIVGPRRPPPGDDEAVGPDLTTIHVETKLESLAGTLDGDATSARDILSELNVRQRALDEARRRLDARRQDLYDAWWRDARLSVQQREIAEGQPQSAVEKARAALKEVRDTIPEREAAVDDALAALLRIEEDGLPAIRAAAAVEPEATAIEAPEPNRSLELRARTAPRFYRPADPVVLIYGGRRSTKHGSDGRWSGDGTLLCRFPEQTLSRLRLVVEDGNEVELSGDGLSELFDLDDLAWTKLPGPARDLAIEALLLDWGCAAALGEALGAGEDEVRDLQRLIWTDHTEDDITTAALTRAAGFTGVRPSPVGVSAWAQPWSPLFLAWRVTWYPSSSRADEGVHGHWTFDGHDYEWAGLSRFDHSKAVTLQGRSILSSTSTKSIQGSLRALVERSGSDDGRSDVEPNGALSRERLDAVLAQLEEADLMAQSLTGFHDQLLQRSRAQGYDPDSKEITELLGDLDRMVPALFADPRSFHPVRAGHFRLERLWVVDAFGQVFDPIAERGQTAASFTPLRGSGLTTLGASQRQDTQMLQLPPRIVQASRLQLRFAASPPQSPVCGWVLPNHLDKSLVIYDAGGEALGAVLRVASSVRWQPSRGGDAIPRSFSEIPDEDLRAMVAGLLQRDDPRPAFEDLLEAIDRTLWTTDPLGRRGNNLSVLIGRPIALVRAELWLELAGDPAVTQSLDGEPGTGGFEHVSFPVRLGQPDLRDDGTLGFFKSEAGGEASVDYSRFHAVQPLVELNEDPQNSYVALPHERTWPRVKADGTRWSVTLLLDPRGSVHACSGILPAKALQLPRAWVDQALERMDVTFRVGPVLGGPRGLRLPLPAEIEKGCSWIAQSGVAVWEEKEITPASQHAHLDPSPTHLREGWLKLSDAIDATDRPSDT